MKSGCAAVLLACWLVSVVASKQSTADSAWRDHGSDDPVFAGVATADYDKDYRGGYKDIQIVQGPVGPTGADGPTGATGQRGEQGIQGIPGPAGQCINCGICPTATAASSWELGDYQFSANCTLCNLNYGTQCNNPTGANKAPLGLAETTCASNLQIGGTCETVCFYYNALTDLACSPGPTYPGVFAVGIWPDASLTTSGWSAYGADYGTKCGAITTKEFYVNEKYWFVCGVIAWKQCCRPGTFTYTNPLVCTSDNEYNYDYTDLKSPAPSSPGSFFPLPQKVVNDINRINLVTPPGVPPNPPGATATVPPKVPCWVQRFIKARASPDVKLPF